jgi:uncharacterized protein
MPTIDGRDFARNARCLEGVLEAADAPRLAELGWQPAGLGYRIEGLRDGRGGEHLRVRASGRLRGVCQRCLQGLELEVAVEEDLELCDSLRLIETAEDDVDRVLAERAMPLEQLVEDELILALPIVPRHDRCESVQEGEPAPAEAGDALRRALRQWVDEGRGP